MSICEEKHCQYFNFSLNKLTLFDDWVSTRLSSGGETADTQQKASSRELLYHLCQDRLEQLEPDRNYLLHFQRKSLTTTSVS